MSGISNSSSPAFIPGLELAGHFYWEAVRPVLDVHFPHLVHAAARLDFGSDVLGFDTPRSIDHDWGPKCTLLLSEADYQSCRDLITEAMAWELPFAVHGYPTHFGRHADGTRHFEATDRRPIDHWVTVTTAARFFLGYLGVDPAGALTEVDWLAIPQQRLRTIASGRVYHDGLNQLEPARRSLQWYPRDIWLYMLANQWRHIDQEEPFMGRCGDVGDELGSRLIASRLVNELMRLCFLIEQQYAPYAKWFGSAFSRLRCAAELAPVFAHVLNASTWQTREKHLAAAYLAVARMHNVLAVTDFVEPQVSRFFDRPYLVPHADRFVDALHTAIRSAVVQALPKHIGAISQFVDSTDVLDSISTTQRLMAIYARDAM